MYRVSTLQTMAWATFALTVAGPTAWAQRAETKSTGSPLVLTADTPWVVAADEPEAMQRALNDVQTDWYKVLGRRPVVVAALPETWKGPAVYLGTKGAWREQLAGELDTRPECFVLQATTDSAGRPALVATGSDVRGSIYAAYALSEEILGVDPWYYWVDKEPAYRGQIEVPAKLAHRFGPPTFRYRGWFINDEDLFSRFAQAPLRDNVFSMEMLDRVCETLLRLRGNMLIPGTFNFPDEHCHELTARRGLIINMHHILVVGLNTYRWPKDVPFSYTQHPDIMEKYWQTCIDAFKGKEIVWTVGYRGKHDRPFWADEPGMSSPEARGKAITEAIAKQVELIRKADPNATIISNLWVEGADLYLAGHLKLPEGVKIVWPDDGAGMIRDRGQVKAGQGIYYHTAMLNGYCNQLGEMANPARIISEVGRFVRAGATEFFLVNVSDVRPVPLSTDCAMKMVWQAEPFLNQPEAERDRNFLTDWSRRQFGPEVAPRVAEIYAAYFNIPYHRDDVRQSDNAIHSFLRRIAVKAAPLVVKGQPIDAELLQLAKEKGEFAAQNRAYVEPVAVKAEALAASIPADRRDFYVGHVIVPLQIHLHSLATLEAYAQSVQAYAAGDKPKAIDYIEQAMKSEAALFAALHRGEYGKWAGWYQGESFVGLNTTHERLRVLKAALTGQPIPPIRAGREYSDLYEYQVPFAKNFPLMYPPADN